MMELKVDLDFVCCTCGCEMGVTLKCAGKGLAGGAHSVAAVKVPCPTCGSINQLYFEPSGTIHAVSPCQGPRQVPEPSVN
jgi:phage FluMu protein Com